MKEDKQTAATSYEKLVQLLKTRHNFQETEKVRGKCLYKACSKLKEVWQPFNNAIEDESLKWALQTRTLIFNGTYTILKIILWVISNNTWQ